MRTVVVNMAAVVVFCTNPERRIMDNFSDGVLSFEQTSMGSKSLRGLVLRA
jgi:hypothetical protein